MKKEGIRIKSKTIIKILLLVVIILSGFLIYQVLNKSEVSKNIDHTTLAKEERDDLLRRVGAHIVLPTDEVPTLATVSDPSQLKQYPFFESAMTGDKVLIYSQNKKAILYRPSEDKIVVIAPILSKQNSENTNNTSSTTNKK
jgi:hypothetical protein